MLPYYRHLGSIEGSSDEAVRHMAAVPGRYGVMKEIDLRKEPLTETEVKFPFLSPPPFPLFTFPLYLPFPS